MGIIDNSIVRLCTQTAVYWGTPMNDGYGTFTFKDPVEINCRWEDKKEVYSGSDNKELVSRAVITVLQDLDEEGYLYLGELDDFDSAADISNPKIILKAYEIKRFDKIPELGSTNKYLRKIYL